MKALFDKNGYVTDFALIGDLVDGVELPDPEDLDYFSEHFSAFRLMDGVLKCDTGKATEVEQEQEKNLYRHLREHECFSVINRGQLWYETLSISQLVELRQWYRAWLKVTETKVVPEKPAWLV